MNEKELFLRLRELIKENANLNKDGLLKDRESLNSELVLLRNELRNYDISNFSVELQKIAEEYENKSRKNLFALIIGIPALLGLTALSDIFLYLLVIYVIVNCVIIKVNEDIKLNNLSKYKELKDYVQLHRNYNSRVLRTDVVKIETRIDIIKRKINIINKKLEKYRVNDSEIRDIQKILFNYEEGKDEKVYFK